MRQRLSSFQSVWLLRSLHSIKYKPLIIIDLPRISPLRFPYCIPLFERGSTGRSKTLADTSAEYQPRLRGRQVEWQVARTADRRKLVCAPSRRPTGGLQHVPDRLRCRCPWAPKTAGSLVGSMAFLQGHARRSLASLFRSGRGKFLLSRVCGEQNRTVTSIPEWLNTRRRLTWNNSTAAPSSITDAATERRFPTISRNGSCQVWRDSQTRQAADSPRRRSARRFRFNQPGRPGSISQAGIGTPHLHH